MRKGKSIPFIFAVVIVIFFTSTSPYVPFYGGKIWFINNSSHNLLLEFLGRYSIYNNIESKIYIEKQEQLAINNPALKGRGMLFLKGIAVGFNTLYNALKGGVLNPPHE